MPKVLEARLGPVKAVPAAPVLADAYKGTVYGVII